MTAAFVLHRADGTADTTAFRRQAFGERDPFARDREIAWDGPDSMAAGRIGFVGDIDVRDYPHIETIVVVEGELTLESADAAPRVLARGEGAVIGCGTTLRLHAEAQVLVVFCAVACAQPHRVNEFMFLLAGSVRFAARDGSVLSLRAGDALFVPNGAPIGWESSERVAKFYVVQHVLASTERD
ncbi:DUF861 domain-containing protein [Burkholderia multivorans]|uniref:cupin domain-containing protein n=1 Tax=Burkholderia multivorans TaxID=87883 RepID=UPI001C211E9C|nr:cupin domain-containing protein [Burkholderia multivorans]MBU9260399.1 DUF861 domain-containing protein [Burkholderia multivorans]